MKIAQRRGWMLWLSLIVTAILAVLPAAPGRAEDPQPGQPIPGASAPSGQDAFHTDLFTGSAGYSVPIAVAPGTAGLQPKLSLAYNSNAGNGWVGRGWDLTGIGYVEQVGPTKKSVPTNTSADGCGLETCY